ncbi:unnamed protein product, partial [Discosporangium mesarthrocarpum]
QVSAIFGVEVTAGVPVGGGVAGAGPAAVGLTPTPVQGTSNRAMSNPNLKASADDFDFDPFDLKTTLTLTASGTSDVAGAGGRTLVGPW